MMWYSNLGGLGPLSAKAVEWSKINCNPVVIDWISFGVPIWKNRPIPQHVMSQPSLPTAQEDWLRGEIGRLVQHEVLREVPQTPKVVSKIFLVPKPAPKMLRMVVDMRFLNKHLPVNSVRYETIDTVLEYIRPHD